MQKDVGERPSRIHGGSQNFAPLIEREDGLLALIEQNAPQWRLRQAACAVEKELCRIASVPQETASGQIAAWLERMDRENHPHDEKTADRAATLLKNEIKKTDRLRPSRIFKVDDEKIVALEQRFLDIFLAQPPKYYHQARVEAVIAREVLVAALQEHTANDPFKAVLAWDVAVEHAYTDALEKASNLRAVAAEFRVRSAKKDESAQQPERALPTSSAGKDAYALRPSRRLGITDNTLEAAENSYLQAIGESKFPFSHTSERVIAARETLTQTLRAIIPPKALPNADYIGPWEAAIKRGLNPDTLGIRSVKQDSATTFVR